MEKIEKKEKNNLSSEIKKIAYFVGIVAIVLCLMVYFNSKTNFLNIWATKLMEILIS